MSSAVGHPEITLNEEDFKFEPGLGEDLVPTGPLQGDVPTTELEGVGVLLAAALLSENATLVGGSFQ
jgi:hypothetical protein